MNAAWRDEIFVLPMSCHTRSLQRRGLRCHWNLQLSNADAATFVNDLTRQEREQDPRDSCVDPTLPYSITEDGKQDSGRTGWERQGKGSDKGLASHRRKDKLNLNACLNNFEISFSKARAQSCRTGSLKAEFTKGVGIRPLCPP